MRHSTCGQTSSAIEIAHPTGLLSLQVVVRRCARLARVQTIWLRVTIRGLQLSYAAAPSQDKPRLHDIYSGTGLQLLSGLNSVIAFAVSTVFLPRSFSYTIPL